MGGCGKVRRFAIAALALAGAVGCGKSTSSDDDDSGQGGSAGHAAAGTSGQGSSGGPSGAAGTAGHGGSAAGSGGGGSGAGIGSGGVGGAELGAGTGGTAGDGGATGGIGGTAGAAGESAGDSGGGSAGSGGTAPSIDCSGDFASPRVVFEAEGERLFSPTLNADETELLYAMGDATTLQFYRSTRASKADSFGAPEPLPELDAACAESGDRTIDLSSDGLSAYLVCYGEPEPDTYTLHIARRAALDAPFVVDPMSYGEVGPSAAIATAELTLYSSGWHVSQSAPVVFERTTTSAPFDAGMPIPGLEDTQLVTPDVSADGLSLFGTIMNSIVLATRASVGDAFSTPEVIIPQPNGGQWISGTISEDCRSLYAVRQVSRAPLTVEVFER